MHTLQPRTWLNDEVIHYYLLLLSRNHESCHFFKSHFMTKLLNHGEGYRYENVRTWARRANLSSTRPGDIFALDKIFFPVNISGMHWALVVAYMKERRLQYYDSMFGDGQEYLSAIMQYLQDEHENKKSRALPHADSWQQIRCSRDTPQQVNGYDCGVFVCMFCAFIASNATLSFNQQHIHRCRDLIALSIMRGYITW
mmetsp:Transcript_9523/g.19406  ORF Transcript_9523/g.19406 Transcript_9523/m.19406 type:complete len:198 (+) Transcript_9523:1-594(+)